MESLLNAQTNTAAAENAAELNAAEENGSNMVCYVEYDIGTRAYKAKPALGNFFIGEFPQLDLIKELLENKAIHKDDVDDFLYCIETIRKGSVTTRNLHVRLNIIGKESAELYRLVFCRIDSRDGKNQSIMVFFYEVQKEYGILIKETKKTSTDSLTGLYNQRGFIEATDELLASQEKGEYLIVEIDVNQFKVINELFGIEEGNRLLTAIADALREASEKIKGGFVAARLRADVFAVCMPHTRRGVDRLFTFCNRAAERWSDKHKVFIAFGLYVITDRTVKIEKMLEHSHTAVNDAKGNYLQRITYFDSKRRASVLQTQVFISEMEEAINKQQFDVYFQPKVNLQTGKIVGAEALVRWIHPERGMISPMDFIPVFEKCGLIYKLDTYVWKKACETLRDLIENGYPIVPISVNVSRVDLCQPDVFGRLTENITRYNIPTQLLSLEITESTYSNRTDDQKAVLRSLQSFGFRIELDDFGSAYSSLNFLCETNIDVLKLDLRSIEGFSEQDDRQMRIISSIGFLANQMDIPSVVEGIETAQQRQFLLESGFNYGQGYYFYRPMPLNEFGDALLDNAKKNKN